jgi:prepilin-type N-terminal cleavage/methylation domain-containing protein
MRASGVYFDVGREGGRCQPSVLAAGAVVMNIRGRLRHADSPPHILARLEIAVRNRLLTFRAFTLVELLVVVAIIALLLALLTPALKRVKAESQKVACQSQLRGIHLAHSSRASDNRGEIAFLPPNGRYGTTFLWQPYFYGAFPNIDSWAGAGLLWRTDYITDPRILYCPANTSTHIAIDAPWGFKEDPYTPQGEPSLGYWRPGVKYTYAQRHIVQRLTQDGISSRSAFIADNFSYSSPNSWGKWWGNYWEEFQGYAVNSHHVTGYNVVYMDGSAEFHADPDQEIALQQLGTLDRLELEGWQDSFDR